MIELVDLRHVNDAVSVVGASYLDALIKTSVSTIRHALGQKTILYQIGFASIVILFDGQDLQPEEKVETITRELKLPAFANGVPVVINAVVGAAPFQLGMCTPQDALRMGVSAARQARQLETEYAAYNTKHDEAHRRRYQLVSQVSDSLEQKEHFNLVYQPRLDLHTGVCASAEALLRWDHPQLGSVSPGEFIPLIEQTALARPITQWVLSRACRQIYTWRERRIDLRLSVNISARNLEEEDFAELLDVAIRESGISPSDLELEFTESALIRFQSRVLYQLTTIRDMGVTLAIDDFGTGYSSFAYLRQLPALGRQARSVVYAGTCSEPEGSIHGPFHDRNGAGCGLPCRRRRS